MMKTGQLLCFGYYLLIQKKLDRIFDFAAYAICSETLANDWAGSLSDAACTMALPIKNAGTSTCHDPLHGQDAHGTFSRLLRGWRGWVFHRLNILGLVVKGI